MCGMRFKYLQNKDKCAASYIIRNEHDVIYGYQKLRSAISEMKLGKAH